MATLLHVIDLKILNGIQEARGSSPLSSTKLKSNLNNINTLNIYLGDNRKYLLMDL